MERSRQQNESLVDAWPVFMQSLEPELSEYDIGINDIPESAIQYPVGVDLERYGVWSGVWSGWGSQGRTVDVKLVVEKISGHTALIKCQFLSDTAGQLCERLLARFDGNELIGTLGSGATVRFRLRHVDAIEFIWQSTGKAWMSGVLSRTDVNSTVSFERIPIGGTAQDSEGHLEAIVFKPCGEGPFPTLIFNHGACGNGTDAVARKQSWSSPPLARIFTERGYMVIFPQRRGRGKSDGLYAEGLEPDGSGYSMRPHLVLDGFQRALDDVDVVLQWVRNYRHADTSRLVLGGQSRGGLLAMAYAASSPGTFKGVINFVGGWIGESAPSAAIVDDQTFGQCAGFDGQSLWIYAESDSYYSTAHSARNFAAYLDAGGKGHYVAVSPDGSQDGHYIVFIPSLWEATIDEYLSVIQRE